MSRSVLITFILLMALYPDVQSRAQSEIDQLISDRLSKFQVDDSLPYITVRRGSDKGLGPG